jgi:3-deoxy-D-manno-octulosonic-acid transferase
MPRWLYSLLLYLLLPFAALWFKWRSRRSASLRVSLEARLAWRPAARADHPLWLHAASVGELRALSALLQVMDDVALPRLVTVGTPTALARAREIFAGDARVSVQAACWDLPGAVRRFLDAAKPCGAVFVETELWPNLIAAAQARAIPLVLVSARLSERSMRGYARWAPGLMRAAVRAFAAIGAQGATDRARFLELGADPARVTVTGNLKFDLQQDGRLEQRGMALRARWAPQRPLWVAGSTHPGEEAVLLAAQRRLLEAARARGTPAPLLAFAPRHPERFAAVARWLAAQDTAAASTVGAGLVAAVKADVLLINQMGVLQDWYAAADVTFVGGSLVPVGGHNLLEAAALAKPVLTGPEVFNAPDVAEQLTSAGGARRVGDAAGLVAALTEWFEDPGAATLAGANAAATVAAHRGAAARARALVTARVLSSGPSASG